MFLKRHFCHFRHSENALSRAVSRIQERVGIPHWTVHDLRRTFATQLGETLRIDTVVIEKRLSHSFSRQYGFVYVK